MRRALLFVLAFIAACDRDNQDNDGDGWTGVEDCDDDDASINPDAVELCDGADNDCDGVIDNDPTDGIEAFEDRDGDGFGGASVAACAVEAGLVTEGGDCDDDNAAISPAGVESCNGLDDDCDTEIDEGGVDGSAFYPDDDGDGFGRDDGEVLACEPPTGHVADPGDCDDGDADVHPDVAEACDGLDNDCDGLVDDEDTGVVGTSSFLRDLDQDGFGDDTNPIQACAAGPGVADVGGDCDDSDADRFPGNDEVCNMVDDDCNGLIDADDAGILDAVTLFVDADGDGYGGDDTEAGCFVGAGLSDNSDDCDDGTAQVFPLAVEVCNGVDDNCNGDVDADDASAVLDVFYEDGDGDGYGGTTLTEACEQPAGTTTVAGDCDDEDALVSPDGTEVCGGGDEDCDGLVDADDPDVVGTTFYADGDGDGFGDLASAVMACDAPPDTVANADDCDDLDPDIHPDADEVCDSIDNDCDGLTDDGDDDVQGPLYYADLDDDGFGDADDPGTAACVQPADLLVDNTDCDDEDPDVNPDGQEVCNGGADDDCDGLVDNEDPDSVLGDWYFDGDGDGFGLGAPIQACQPPADHVVDGGDCNDGNPMVFPGAPEVCNGIDDDCVNGTDDADPNVDAPLYYSDVDGDGFGVGAGARSCVTPPNSALVDGDCNDGDPTANPDGTEVCGGGDEDCDGLVDLDDDTVSDAFLQYPDLDNDGSGAEGSTGELTCVLGATFSADDLDCNDGDSNIFVGQDEVCDGGTDNDCDGLVDAADPGVVDAQLGYADEDGDGYGDETDPGAQVCLPDPAFVSNNLDCDDDNDIVNPDPRFDFGDGVDQDCDGDTDEDVGFEQYTLADDVQPIFDNNCATCHVPGGSGGLTLNGHAAIVDHPSNQVPTMDYIEPGDPLNSYLFHKVSNTQGDVGGAGVRMPRGRPALLTTEIDVIETWILEGAVP